MKERSENKIEFVGWDANYFIKQKTEIKTIISVSLYIHNSITFHLMTSTHLRIQLFADQQPDINTVSHQPLTNTQAISMQQDHKLLTLLSYFRDIFHESVAHSFSAGYIGDNDAVEVRVQCCANSASCTHHSVFSWIETCLYYTLRVLVLVDK